MLTLQLSEPLDPRLPLTMQWTTLEGNEDMKSQEKPSGFPDATNHSKRIIPDKPDQNEPRTRDGRNRKIDRPGFDLGGSSDDNMQVQDWASAMMPSTSR